MNHLAWFGHVDGKHCRIVRVAINDCIVEIHTGDADVWIAADDDAFCARVYMTAFLEECMSPA